MPEGKEHEKADTYNIPGLPESNAKIADGAVTDAKISGPISVSKLEKPANVIVVAKSGGDFTSISDALASLPDPNPTPILIKIMPGTYTENINMKSNIALQGSGAAVTIIESGNAGGRVVELSYVNNVTVSNLTISGGTLGSRDAFYVFNSTLVAHDNVINGYHDSGFEINGASSDVVIRGNIISGTRYGIIFGGISACKIINNRILNNSNYGIRAGTGQSIIQGNEVVDNYRGIDVQQYASPTIIHNKITNSTSGYDVSVISSTATFSFNVFDQRQPDTSLGIYNIKSDNTPW